MQEEIRVEKMERLITGEKKPQEQASDKQLRPKGFSEFPGQQKVTDKLKVFVKAAQKRGEPLDHTLLCGPPGLGKTTLSHIIAHELNAPFVSTSGPALSKKGDLAAILTSIKPNTILFIDEIHRINKDIEEYMYSAMEDFYLDIVTGEGLGARSMRFQIAPFTLVGATTRAGLLKAPFRDRFGIIERLSFYDKNDLKVILNRSAEILDVKLDEKGAVEIARRSRGTPRVANRLLRRVRDYAEVKSNGVITDELAQYALDQLEVDRLGLDQMDRKILNLIYHKFAGGPVGIETMSSALGEESDTIEEVYEPYLLQEGLIQKTPRGRTLTELSKLHLLEMGDINQVP